MFIQNTVILNQLVKVLFFVAMSTSCWSQMPSQETGDYIYRSHWTLGVKLTTNGLGGQFNYELRATEKFRHSFHAGINHVRTQNESRQTNPFYEDSKAYIFGKINQLYTINVSYGGSWKLYEKKRLNGISIRFNQQVGLSYGYVKPVYIKTKEPFVDDISIQPEIERYDPIEHTEAYVYGRASKFKGFSEGKSAYGMFAKSGFQFDFSPNKSNIAAVELGIQLDIYGKKIPLFYTGKNYSVFPALYGAVLLGKNKI